MGHQVYLLWSFPRFQQTNNPTAISNRPMGKFRGHICVQKRLFVLWNTLQIEWVKVKKFLQKGWSVWGQIMFSPSSIRGTEWAWMAPSNLSTLCISYLYLVGQDMSQSMWYRSTLSITYLTTLWATGKMQTSGKILGRSLNSEWILSTHKWQWRYLDRVIFQHKSYLDEAILTSHLQVEDDHILYNTYFQIGCLHC